MTRALAPILSAGALFIAWEVALGLHRAFTRWM